MRIGIDISQIVHEGTGVGNYVRRMTAELIKLDSTNDYILFGSSMRRIHQFYKYFKDLDGTNKKVRLVVIPLPPTLLHILWNKLHIIPIEWFTGPIDVFWSSDWTQPPLAQAKGVTTIHDLTVLRYPESFSQGMRNIVEAHKRKLKESARSCHAFFCDSEASKNDAMRFLQIPADKLFVVYPGF